jgi:hypothetical protein
MQLRTVHLALAVAVFVAAAALLNPSPERHREKIKQVSAERSQLAALLHLGDFAAFVSNYHSIGLASYTTANEKVLSVGAFGIVIVPDSSKER